MDWQHTIPDTHAGLITPAAAAVYRVGRVIVERLDYIAGALERAQATSDDP